jgi:Asp-tRNA(Asn)/Glu-tRNA(Gln) amidotransferase A subunit family amidase
VRAREADEALARGEIWGALHGVPFTLKDAHATAGLRTTTGSHALDHTPQEDGTVAARLKAAGGILMGKTNVAVMLGDPGQTVNPIFGRTSNPYLDALHRRDEAIIAWEKFFESWDVLLCPVSMVTAFPHCETGSSLQVDGEEVLYWLVNAHTTLFNYTGHPACGLPYALDGEGLPIGVQIVGKRWGDSELLGVAAAISTVTGEFRRPQRY